MNQVKHLKIFLVYFFLYSYSLFSQPIVTSVNPPNGPVIGGNAVDIQGSGFTGSSSVQFGSQNALAYSVINDNLIMAIAPTETPKTVNVLVTTPIGNSFATKQSSYTYQGVWFAYTTQFASDKVIPINTDTNTPSAPIIVGNSPGGIAITPDGSTGYVTVSSLNKVVAIDLATNTVISAIPTGTNPLITAITPDGKAAYVTNYGSNNVTPIDLTTNPPTPGIAIPVGLNPIYIAITVDGKKAYVVDTTSAALTVIDLTTKTPIGTIPVGIRPVAATTAPNGTRVYVTEVNMNAVAE